MNHKLYLPLIVTTLLFTSCLSKEMQYSPFSFKESEQGIELLENGKPLLFYQRKPKSATGQYLYANYLHPLYGINGDTLTEEFPPDHPHHRGIFWAWHQIYVNGQSIGDGWINENIYQDVSEVKTEKSKDSAKISLNVLWKSTIFQNGDPFLRENTAIIIHQPDSELRKIDFRIKLTSLFSGLEIGGSDDQKGYGGFCARIKLPAGLTFTSENGDIIPGELQMEAGPWIDFSGVYGVDRNVSGLTIMSHPDNPGFPEPWILRQKGSMQNIVYPGRRRISIPKDKPLILQYRIVIHKGDIKSVNINILRTDGKN